MKIKLILNLLAKLLGMQAISMLPSLAVSIRFGDGDWLAFVQTIVIICALAVPTIVITRKAEKNLGAREGMVVVALTWILFSFFGALPFVLSGVIPDLENAVFESVSGFTTTGASVMPVLEGMPRGIMFWRSFTHWIGGMGVLVLALAVLPSITGRTSHLLRAESPGPSLSRLVPKLGETAKILYTIYGALTLVLVLLLMLGGMNVYDALIHAFGTAGTGGFSNRGLSVGGFHSPWIEGVITLFMLLFGVNFTIHYRLLHGGWREARKDEELRVYLLIAFFGIMLVTASILPHYQGNLLDAIRYGSFQVSSILSTTGYSTADFNQWPQFTRVLLVLLMFIGSSAGSTAGGIKVTRIMMLVKGARKQLRQLLQPRRVQVIKMDGKAVEDGMLSLVATFFFVYMMLLFAGTLLISLDNQFNLETNLTATLSCLSNIGPGLGAVGPMGNFSQYSVFSKMVLSLCMLAGRLEIFPMLILFSPSVWRKQA